MQGSDDLLGFVIGESWDIPNHFNSELISYGSIPDTFRTDLVEPIISNFTGDTIGWNSDPFREYLWFSQSYAKNSQLPNTFQNTKKRFLCVCVWTLRPLIIVGCANNE